MDLTQLSPYQPRAFVPKAADLSDAKTVVGFYEQIEARPIQSVKELERRLRVADSVLKFITT